MSRELLALLFAANLTVLGSALPTERPRDIARAEVAKQSSTYELLSWNGISVGRSQAGILPRGEDCRSECRYTE